MLLKGEGAFSIHGLRVWSILALGFWDLRLKDKSTGLIKLLLKSNLTNC